jgi:hypothetical protein
LLDSFHTSDRIKAISSKTNYLVGAVPRSSSSEFPGTANASSGVTVPVATTKAAEADVSHIEHIDISASADARPAISAPTPAASTYDANTQS